MHAVLACGEERAGGRGGNTTRVERTSVKQESEPKLLAA
jgi:hypothetical protein